MRLLNEYARNPELIITKAVDRQCLWTRDRTFYISIEHVITINTCSEISQGVNVNET